MRESITHAGPKHASHHTTSTTNDDGEGQAMKQRPDEGYADYYARRKSRAYGCIAVVLVLLFCTCAIGAIRNAAGF